MIYNDAMLETDNYKLLSLGFALRSQRQDVKIGYESAGVNVKSFPFTKN